MDYNIDGFRKSLAKNVTLSSAYSNKSLRILVEHLLKGGNYRLITERNTKDKLFLTYLWIYEIYTKSKDTYGANWKQGLLKELNGVKKRTIEQQNLYIWLIGITHKTAVNLDIKGDLTLVLEEMDQDASKLLNNVNRREDLDIAWLFLMAGAATLTIRGSDKSKVGKQLERILIKSALTILGFTFNENFWINIGRDNEVGRETDAEVQTKRGRIRLEVGLIAPGNQEVIEDKIGRVGRNGVILFDKIGERSNIHGTAESKGVKLIQIRGGNPLAELHTILKPLVSIRLNDYPQTKNEIEKRVAALPDEIFDMEDGAYQ
jgi:hypothetical protein